MLHHNVRRHVAGEECEARVLTKTQQIVMDFGVLYDAELVGDTFDTLTARVLEWCRMIAELVTPRRPRPPRRHEFTSFRNGGFLQRYG